MCEVTVKNFDKIFPEIENALRNARFVAVDTEFSCLNAFQKLQNSLFDSGIERYAKLRATVEQMIPVQIGLSAFTFDPDNNSYNAHIYTFYIFPRPFSFVDRKFLCQASSFQFLCSYNFDFNKLITEGISYLNRAEEADLLKHIRNGNLAFSDSCMPNETENIFEEARQFINKWISSAKDDDILILKDVEKYRSNLDIKYFLHKELRHGYKNLWTMEDDEGFKVQKVTSEMYDMLTKNFNLDEYFILNLLGFSRIFRLLTSLQKPIIGHNLLLDLMVMIQNFEKPLPKSYTAFKKLVHTLFPTIFDSKCISFDIKLLVPESKRWRHNTLEHLYEYFKDGHGRHLALNSPLIEPYATGLQNFHYAGWDSYCTGYIFIRMAHIYATQGYSNVRGKKFMSNELLQAVAQFKNSVNIIRGDLSHIQLDGDDPVSKRPPWLVVETLKNKPISISQVTSLLSTYGFVEVKPFSLRGHRAIIAVDNFGSARRILRQFKSHSDFRFQQYNVLKHSPLARAVLWSGIFVSGAVLAWYGYSRIK